MVVAPNCSLGDFHELKGMNQKKKITKKGCIIRQGDIVKFGRVPIMIKESSIDQTRWEAYIKRKEVTKNDERLNAHQINIDTESNNASSYNDLGQNMRFGRTSL